MEGGLEKFALAYRQFGPQVTQVVPGGGGTGEICPGLQTVWSSGTSTGCTSVTIPARADLLMTEAGVEKKNSS